MLRKPVNQTLRCGNQVIELDRPLVMGILNATPDSFYPDSRVGRDPQRTIDRAGQMLSEGASILDVGGMSTRPGAEEISPEEEQDRVVPAIQALKKAFPDALLSVDTYRSQVADEACKAGATMINDISGGQFDESIWTIAANHHAAYVLMHTRGTPDKMQLNTEYQDIIGDLLKYFIHRLAGLRSAGVTEVILDPGFGFAKTIAQNYEVIRRLQTFCMLELPIMVGVSRKSTLSKTIGREVSETLFATTALHMAALQNGASILRVHDVRPAMDAIAVFTSLQP